MAILLAALGCAAGIVTSPAVAATDGPYADVYWVNSCATAASVNPAPIFSARTFGAMTTAQNCASMSAGLQIDAIRGVGNGASGNWSAITPTPAIRIIGVDAWGIADCNLHQDGFNASYYYGDNGTNYGVPQITIDCHGLSGATATPATSTRRSPHPATSASKPHAPSPAAASPPAPTASSTP